MLQIRESPLLAFFYAFGFAAGNIDGIKLENMLALGYINLRVICRKNFQEIYKSVRDAGYAVTAFFGGREKWASRRTLYSVPQEKPKRTVRNNT